MTDVTGAKTFEGLYQVACKVGRGGFSDVYRFVRRDTKKEYAAKMIYCDSTNRDDVLREVKICQRLNHRNIVQLVEYFLQPRRSILVFDMVWGGELFDDIAEREKYSEQDACQCIEQILQGVAYLHQNEIIHRDLKPENILLTNTGEDAVVKIADFGSAVETKGRERYEYGRAGTDYYMAPEVHNLLAYGTPVDLWPCGTLLYIMLVGESPGHGENVNLYRLVELGLLRYPDEDGNDAICDEAKDLIGQLLTLNQDKRTAAADALMHPFIRSRTKVASRFHRRNTIDELKKFIAIEQGKILSQDFSPSTSFMRSCSIQENIALDAICLDVATTTDSQDEETCTLRERAEGGIAVITKDLMSSVTVEKKTSGLVDLKTSSTEDVTSSLATNRGNRITAPYSETSVEVYSTSTTEEAARSGGSVSVVTENAPN